MRAHNPANPANGCSIFFKESREGEVGCEIQRNRARHRIVRRVGVQPGLSKKEENPGALLLLEARGGESAKEQTIATGRRPIEETIDSDSMQSNGCIKNSNVTNREPFTIIIITTSLNIVFRTRLSLLLREIATSVQSCNRAKIRQGDGDATAVFFHRAQPNEPNENPTQIKRKPMRFSLLFRVGVGVDATRILLRS